MSQVSSIRNQLPTVLTLINAGCGIVGLAVLVLAGQSALPIAAGLIFVGWAFDIADGLAARLLRATSKFGQSLDSLADAICFVVLPTLLVLAQANGDPLVLVAAGIFAMCGLLRLGRFSSEETGDAMFSGLPSVVAAMLVAALVLVVHGQTGIDIASGYATSLFSLVLLMLGLLMVSRIPYNDLPKRLLRGEIPRWPFVIACIAIVIDPTRLLLTIALLLYVGFYPMYALIAQRAT